MFFKNLFLKKPNLKKIFKHSKSDLENFDNPELLFLFCPGWEIISPPLSLATLAAMTRAKGIKTLSLDLNLEYMIRPGYRAA